MSTLYPVQTPQANGMQIIPAQVAAAANDNIYVGDWSGDGGGVGNDTTGDGSLATPYATMLKAERMAADTRAVSIIRLARGVFTAPLNWHMRAFGGPDSAPPIYSGLMTDQFGALTVAAGSSAKHVITSGAPVFRSGAAAAITAITGNGQQRTMTVTGMSGLTAADVGKNFLFALATNKSTANTATTSTTFGTPTSAGAQTLSGLTGGLFVAQSVGNYVYVTGAANAANNGLKRIIAFVSATSVTVYNPAGVAETTSVTWQEQGLHSHETGNNGMFKMAAFISATSATFYNAQALVEDTSAIYWQDCFRGDWLHFNAGAGSPINAAALVNTGGRCITDHGERASSPTTFTSNPANNDTYVVPDGTNTPVTFTFKTVLTPAANEVLIGATVLSTLTNLIQTINQNAPNSGATPLRVRAYRTGPVSLRLVNMLPGSVGNAAGPTMGVGAYATITTFATAATGVGTPTTTFTLQGAGFSASAPVAGNEFVVEKNGTFIDCPANCEIKGSPYALFMNLRLRATTGFMLQFNAQLAHYQLSIEGNQGSAVQVFNGVMGPGIYSAVYANAVGLLPTGLPFFPSIYLTSITLNCNAGSSFADMVVDHSSLQAAAGSRLGQINVIDARRSTVICSLVGGATGFLNSRSRMLGTLNTADAAIMNVSTNGSTESGAASATPSEVAYSSGYGLIADRASNVVLAALGGSGNALAGLWVDNGSYVRIDNLLANTTAITGERGDIELGHEDVPNVRTYAEARQADQYNNKSIADSQGNRVAA